MSTGLFFSGATSQPKQTNKIQMVILNPFSTYFTDYNFSNKKNTSNHPIKKKKKLKRGSTTIYLIRHGRVLYIFIQ
jgi:hypothetical protein